MCDVQTVFHCLPSIPIFLFVFWKVRYKSSLLSYFEGHGGVGSFIINIIIIILVVEVVVVAVVVVIVVVVFVHAYMIYTAYTLRVTGWHYCYYYVIFMFIIIWR